MGTELSGYAGDVAEHSVLVSGTELQEGREDGTLSVVQVILGSQAVQDGISGIIQHGTVPGAEPGFGDPELPADRLDGLVRGAVDALLNLVDSGLAQADTGTKLLHGKVIRLADFLDAVA